MTRTFQCEKCGHAARVISNKRTPSGTVRRLGCKHLQCSHRWTAAPDQTPPRNYRGALQEQRKAQQSSHQITILDCLTQGPATSEQIQARTGLSAHIIYDVLAVLRHEQRCHIGAYFTRPDISVPTAIHHAGPGEDVPKPTPLTREERNHRRKLRRDAERQRKQSQPAAPAVTAAAITIDPDVEADAQEKARKARLVAKIKPFRDHAVAALFGDRAYITVTRRQVHGMGKTEKILRTLGRHAERGASQAGQRHV